MRPTMLRAMQRDHVAGGERDLHDAVVLCWTMSARLRIVRSGSVTTMVARPGCSAEAGTMW
jgi:hypothetical protein